MNGRVCVGRKGQAGNTRDCSRAPVKRWEEIDGSRSKRGSSGDGAVWQVAARGEEKAKATSDSTTGGVSRRWPAGGRTTSSRRSPGWAPPGCWTCWLCAGPGPPLLNPGDQQKQETETSAGRRPHCETRLVYKRRDATNEQSWFQLSRLALRERLTTG